MPITIDGSNGVTFPDTTTQTTAPASGRLIRSPQIITSGTSYTTPAGCNRIFIELVGGGGGGGGSQGSTSSRGGGGAAGRWAFKTVAVSPSTTYTITIGAGGAGGVNAVGSNGGDTSIIVGGVTYSSNGGGGGGFGNGSTGGVAGSASTTTNMDYSIEPDVNTAAVFGTSVGKGAVACLPFIPPLATLPSTNAFSPTVAVHGYGASANGSSGNGATGGAGTQGAMRIWEYS